MAEMTIEQQDQPQGAAMLPALLTMGEAKAALRVCGDTVRRMLERGDLAGFTAGGTTRITRASVERLLTGGRPT